MCTYPNCSKMGIQLKALVYLSIVFMINPINKIDFLESLFETYSIE